jgi:hypothetical protein
LLNGHLLDLSNELRDLANLSPLDVNKAADEKGVVIVGGGSYSVGAAGGWILGGGHSSLSPQYGLGVDSKWPFCLYTHFSE